MYGQSKAKYLEGCIDALKEENRSLREENKVLRGKIDYYTELIDADSEVIEQLKQRFREAEASYAEEIERAHEAQLAFYEVRDEMKQMKKIYEEELRSVLKRARRAVR